KIGWGADEKDNLLAGAGLPDLLVEFERFRRGVSANVEHHEIVDIGLPQKSCGGDLFSLMYLDSATPQDRTARFAGCVAAVDQENFLIGKSRAATKWWAIHGTPPETSAPSSGRWFEQSLRRERRGVNINRHRGTG